MNIGETLKEHRKANNLSLLQLEKATGISNQNLSRWENNKIIPGIDFCIILAEYYGITLDELVGRDFPPAGTVYYKSAVNNKIGNNSKIEIK